MENWNKLKKKKRQFCLGNSCKFELLRWQTAWVKKFDYTYIIHETDLQIEWYKSRLIVAAIHNLPIIYFTITKIIS